MVTDTLYAISRSSLLEALDIARWSGEDAESILNSLISRNEAEEVEEG